MTELHADLEKPAFVDGATLPWDRSPSAGVWRRRIERVGDEVARVTSVVRYDAGTGFPSHVHGGGEELFVLSGVFSDEHGDFGAGTWLRNGVGSAHTPRSAEGCELLVKLWWMHPEETDVRRVDTRAPSAWTPTSTGARCLLHEGAHDVTELLRLPPGAKTTVIADGGAEVFVIEGAVQIDGEAGVAQSWWRRPRGALMLTAIDDEAVVYVKRGHLRAPPPLPTT